MEYVAYSDESSITASRYRSQCVLSLGLSRCGKLRSVIREAYGMSGPILGVESIGRLFEIV